MKQILSNGRATSGTVTGKAVVLTRTFTFFGDIDWDTGALRVPGDPLNGISIAGKVFVFPSPSGGQGTAWKICEMVGKGVGPLAIVVHEANSVLVSGCVLARVPLVADLPDDPTAHCATGQRVTVDAECGTISVSNDD